MDGTAATWVLVASAMTVMVTCHQVCFIGSEYNPQSGTPPRLFLPYKDPCECTAIRLGGMRIPASSYRQGEPCYLDQLFLSEDCEEIQAYFNCNVSNLTTVCTEPDIFLTKEKFSADEFDAAEERCRECEMQVCTLGQMKLAYEFGSRILEFGLYQGAGGVSADRKARVSSCNSSQECLYEGRDSREIPKVPLSVGEEVAAYCCRSTGPTLTMDKFRCHEVARRSCQGLYAQLCPLVLLADANNRGYVTNESGWYVSPYRAYVGDGEVVVDNDTKAVHDGAYCCPMKNSFILSKDKYHTHGEAQAFCGSIGFHLCSLAELKSARDHGFWSGVWGHYEVEGREVKVYDCKFWSGPQCYDDVIANTPRPEPLMRVYCCP